MCGDKLNNNYLQSIITHYDIRKYIKQLNIGSAPGIDNISSGHLKFGIDTSLPVLLSNLVTEKNHGVLPKSFMKGLLIPILKNTNIDPTIPNNYRPITVSVMFSKLLEYHILDRCYSHQFSAHQFGLVANRECDMATALVHDVCAYANASGSALFLCSLDAEGAFDFLPHVVILLKAIRIISDEFWRPLHVWYSNMTIKIRWNMKLLYEIIVERKMSQGGLTTPYLFNLFYQPLIESLNLCKTGITVGGCNLNAV